MTGRSHRGIPVDIEIRTVPEESFEDFLKADYRAFGEYPRREDFEPSRKVFEPARTLAGYDGGQMVGTAAAATFSLTVPGGEVPMAGVTGVGVVPTHRRRGILTHLMRRQLDDVREAGEPVAGLWASESVIYGRFGYGMAAYSTELEMERARSQFLRPLDESGRVRLVDREEALEILPVVFDRFRARQPGFWSRTPGWWDLMLADLEHRRDGATALWFVIHETEGQPDGYATYRVKHDWSGAFPADTLLVRELIAGTDQAYARLWRYCFDVDLIAKIEAWPRAVDEPLFHMLADPRRLSVRVFDGLWLRLIDIPRALSARRYSSDGRIALDLRDEFCPWNEGRYELEAGPDGAECSRTEGEPDLVLSAADLGAVYLGGVPFASLARAGRVQECRDGALRRADALFAWDPQPWCPAVF
jgi:predicted acetyltransferase